MKKQALAGLLAAALALPLAGCGGSDPAPSSTPDHTVTVTHVVTPTPADATTTGQDPGSEPASHSQLVRYFRQLTGVMLQGNTAADNKAYADAVCERVRMNYTTAELVTFTRDASSGQLTRGQSRLLVDAAVAAFCPSKVMTDRDRQKERRS